MKNVVTWDKRTEIYVGDTTGDPVTLLAGIVTVNGRTTVGLQRADENTPHDQPNYTLDTLALDDMVKSLVQLRAELVKHTGGL